MLINLSSYTKPNKSTHNIHKSTTFYHSNKFRPYCAILGQFLHQVLKLANILEITVNKKVQLDATICRHLFTAR